MMKSTSLAIGILSLTLLAACSKNEASTPDAVASAPTVAVVEAPAAPAVEENAIGKSVYGKTCALCHAANVAGAPKPGDKVDWAPRIAQGMDVLHKHAIEGFTGAKGQMPARGGSTTLTDDEVKAGVDYMVAKSR